MRNKPMTGCVVLAAFVAFAVMPTGASAINDPEITHPTGTLLGTGTTFKATNIGEIVFTDGNTNVLTRCTTAGLTGTITKNNGSEVEGTIISAEFGGTGENRECTSSSGGFIFETNIGNGVPWCLRSTPTMTTDEFQIRGGACSEAARGITFIHNSTTIGKCRYERTAPVPGTHQTHPEDAKLSFSHLEFAKEEGSFLCGSKTFLDMSFTFETDTAASADSLYIS